MPGAIAGAVAEAFHGGVPEAIAREVCGALTPELLRVVDAVTQRYGAAVQVAVREHAEGESP